MINRLVEVEQIEEVYAKNDGQPSILILYAYTGIGKSCLVDEIFSKKLNSAFVRVEINQDESEDLNGLYTSSLAKSLNKYAFETGKFPTVEDFINNIYNIDFNREKVINDLLDIIASSTEVTKTIKAKIDQSKNLKENIVEKVLQNNNDISASFLLEYITHISANNNLIISIENIQNTNSKFISFLRELIKKSKKLFLIGEYTIEKSTDEILNLYRQFPTESVQVYELKKLNKRELIGAIKASEPEDIANDVCKIIEDSYDISSGNLIKLELLLKQNQLGFKNFKTKKYDDALHNSYSVLTNNQKMVLWFIVTHLGKVNVDVFKLFLKNIQEDEQRVFEALKILKNLKLIKISDRTIALEHDSIFELLKEEEEYFKFISIANRKWLNFYKEITAKKNFDYFLELGISKENILILQLTLIINIGGDDNIDWMNCILSEINNSLTNNISGSLIFKLKNIFRQVIKTNSNKNLLYQTYERTVLMLYKLGLSEEISSLSKQYVPSNPSKLLFLVQSSARIVACDPTVIIELEKIHDKRDSFLSIGVQLLLIRYYRTFNQFKKAKLIWEKLLSPKYLTPYKEIIYEYVNVASFNMTKRLKYLRLAEDGNKNFENNYHLCSTLLNINATLYYQFFWKIINKKDFLTKAERNLNRVKELLSDSYYPMHKYLNQRTIFQWVSGKVSDEKLMENFQAAYRICGIPPNKSLIGSNIIAIALKQRDFLEIEPYVNELMENSRRLSNLNSEFAMYPLINCYNYFREIGDNMRQNETITLFRKGKIFNNFMDYLVMAPFLTEIFFKKIGYYPCNIVNWQIDFESIQQQL